jgi:hypothetical protein
MLRSRFLFAPDHRALIRVKPISGKYSWTTSDIANIDNEIRSHFRYNEGRSKLEGQRVAYIVNVYLKGVRRG